MTILIGFHQSCYRNFKSYYVEKVQMQWGQDFPGLVSYGRFTEWIPSTLIPLCADLRSCFGQCTGISFMDSTCLKVCWAGDPPSSHNRRISQHRVFKNLAARGKTSVDWFFGFKLHLVVNDRGELLACQVTPGNVDDRKPVPKLLQHICVEGWAEIVQWGGLVSLLMQLLTFGFSLPSCLALQSSTRAAYILMSEAKGFTPISGKGYWEEQ